jgi:hypothetical protein
MRELTRHQVDARLALGSAALVCAAGLLLALVTAANGPAPRLATLLQVGGVALAASVCVYGACRWLLSAQLRALTQLSASIDDIELDGDTIYRSPPERGPVEVERIVAAWNGFALRFDIMMHGLREQATALNASTHRLRDLTPPLAPGARTVEEAAHEVHARMREARDGNAATKRLGDAAVERTRFAKARMNDIVQQLREVATTIRELEGASDGGRAALRAVDDVALQANTLALHAALEAGRAGAAGKGFALVADEIRSLGQRVADAARGSEPAQAQVRRSSARGQQLLTQLTDAFAGLGTTLQELLADTLALQQEVATQGDAVVIACARTEELAAAARESTTNALVLEAAVGVVGEAAAAVEARVWPKPDEGDRDIVALGADETTAAAAAAEAPSFWPPQPGELAAEGTAGGRDGGVLTERELEALSRPLS